jgi:hypothetical protein
MYLNAPRHFGSNISVVRLRLSHASTLVPGHPSSSAAPPVVSHSPQRTSLCQPVRLSRWLIAYIER